jgi:serine/threonine protein kinase
MGSERSDRDPRNPKGSKAHDNSNVSPRAPEVSDPRGVGVLSGRTVGRYQLILPIGAGGMAQVWAAKPKTGGLARTVAMKLVLPEFSEDPEYGKMFVDEAMVASAVRHPNVCEIHELGRDGDLLFMVLEWIAGDSLTGLLSRGTEFRPLPDEIAARIASEACAGLHAAHEALGPDGQPLGIVHRDVSPPNILVSLQGHVKVSDFGIAKARYQLHSRTRTGEIKGKFAYIPPEQILGRGVDRRADIYAMGCVLYVATLGLRPFGGGAGALGKIVQGQYLKPSDLRPRFPKGLELIIERALMADPARRFQSAEEMRHALEVWLVESGRIVVDSDVARIVKERLSPERRTVIDAVQSSGRSLPEALAYRLLSRGNRADTPTADSRVFLSPPPPRSEKPLVDAPDGSNPPDQGDAEAAPTWRPPFAARVPEEVTEVPRMPNSGFLNDEAESTVRDRLSPSSPPRFVSTKPPKVEKKK